MKRGVQVDLLELRQDDNPSDGPSTSSSGGHSTDDAARGDLTKALVLAWVEEGAADLEFDGRRARPQPGSFFGAAPCEANQGSVRISVKQGVPGVPA
jgi:hypothetical protein